MSVKRWFVAFFVCVALIFGSVAAFNVAVDPFGVFGDKLLQFYSYDYTNNPRAAKIAWLDEHHGEYDSYILGGSLTSSYPVAKLNEYMDAKFYNVFGYGADMHKTRGIAEYILNNYDVKNLIVNISVVDAQINNLPSDRLVDALHCETSGESPLSFYGRFAFANPTYSLAKLKAVGEKGYLPSTFNVFNVQTGAYDKRRREIEVIHSEAQYVKNNPVFQNFNPSYRGLYKIDDCIRDITAIKELCAQKGVNLRFIFSPFYYPDYLSYKPDEVAAFQRAIAKVTDFWDFSLSEVSMDSRYFYDTTHFRNEVGVMALAKMFGDGSVYVPENLGSYVTAENVDEHVKLFYQKPAVSDSVKNITVLTYHNIDDDASNPMNVSAEAFETQMLALRDEGYETVSLTDLVGYVEKGTALPEKPLVITFDDGYLSNYEKAYPILQKYGMKAAMFVIGVSVGKDTYKDTGVPIFPHFSYEQAKEMADSGLVEIYSHTYDMHQSKELDTDARSGVLQKEGEGEADYIAAFRRDFETSSSLISDATGKDVIAFCYPEGRYTPLSEALLKELGVKVTLSTNPGTNEIMKGLPQTLVDLNRITMHNDTDVAHLGE